MYIRNDYLGMRVCTSPVVYEAAFGLSRPEPGRTKLRKAAGPEEPATRRVYQLPIEALPPRPAELGRLGEADRFLLAKLFEDGMVEFVDHPAYHQPDAEVDLFGHVSCLAKNSTYFVETDESSPASVGAAGAVLTAAEEQLLFQRFNYARYRVAALFDAHRGQRLAVAALREVLGWMHRVLMIRGRIAQVNISLVTAMACRGRFAHVDPSEAISAGNMALLRSIDRFDCGRGFKFSTYACQSIVQRILHVVDATNRYRSRFSTEFDEALEASDWVELRHEMKEADRVDDLREILGRNRAGLNPTEQTVISRRFGIGSEPLKPMTLQELGEMLGITKERVRQIQKRAFQKIRHVLERDYLAA